MSPFNCWSTIRWLLLIAFCLLPNDIYALICILHENQPSSPQVLNVFDIDNQSNSTCCRIRLTNSSTHANGNRNKLCFTEASYDEEDSDSVDNNSEQVNRQRTLIKALGDSNSSPVNAVCMKGEIIFCTQINCNANGNDLSTPKTVKHRRKTVIDGFDNGGDDDSDEISNDIHPYQTDQSYKEIIIVAPTRPNLSPNRDIKVEYVIGEEVKLACLLESKEENQVVWMKDNHSISLSSPSTSKIISDIDYQIVHNSINSFIILDILKITIDSANASGLYTCSLKNSSTHQGESMSFQVIATSSREYAEYKFKRPNITGFIVGMIPSIMLFFYIIMSLGYRSRYAMEQEEEEEGLGI